MWDRDAVEYQAVASGTALGLSFGFGVAALAACGVSYIDVGSNLTLGSTTSTSSTTSTGGTGASITTSASGTGVGSTASATGTGGAAPIDGTIVVSGLNNPNSLAVDAMNVYWADGDDGTVEQADIAMGTTMQLASGQPGVRSLVITSGDLLLWADPNAGNIDGTTPGHSFMSPLVTGQASPNSVAPFNAGSTLAFWTTLGSASTAGGVWDYEFTQQNITYLAGRGGKICATLLSTGCATVVYATDDAGGTLWTTSFTPYQTGCSAGVGTQTMLVTGVGIAGLAMDATFAYWTDGIMSGSVAKVPVDGGAPTVLAQQQAMPSDVAVDPLYVYWINQGGSAGSGAVMKAQHDGATPTILASGRVAPRGLFITATDVYWIAGAKGQGAIKTVPK
jgi:hypothetical protein